VFRGARAGQGINHKLRCFHFRPGRENGSKTNTLKKGRKTMFTALHTADLFMLSPDEKEGINRLLDVI
jgi:hypothetical protein